MAVAKDASFFMLSGKWSTLEEAGHGGSLVSSKWRSGHMNRLLSTLMAESEEEPKSLLMKVKEEVKKLA